MAVPSTFSFGQAMTGASLADADGVLYVGTGTDVTPEGQGSMWALDDATGHVRWETDMGGCVQYPASIAIENRRPFRVIAGTSAAPSIQGLNPATGEQIWSEEDLCFGQTVHGDVVYYADLSSQSIQARSVANGKLLWQYVDDDFNFNRPVVAGNVVYATNLGSRVYAFDALRGDCFMVGFTGACLPRCPDTI